MPDHRSTWTLAVALVFLIGCSRTTSSQPLAPTAEETAESTDTSPPAEAPTTVSISLLTARARWVEEFLMLDVELVVHNRSGSVLNVISTCSSAFDGLAVVLRDPSGRELHRQFYLAHQSPYAEGQVYPLPEGNTTRQLTYPLFEAPPNMGTVEVTIEGGFPGTPWPSGLASGSFRITVPVVW